MAFCITKSRRRGVRRRSAAKRGLLEAFSHFSEKRRASNGAGQAKGGVGGQSTAGPRAPSDAAPRRPVQSSGIGGWHRTLCYITQVVLFFSPFVSCFRVPTTSVLSVLIAARSFPSLRVLNLYRTNKRPIN